MVPRHVVFVCTGNTCRSPLAEVIARAALREAGLGLVSVASAGLRAAPGCAAAAEAEAVAEARGLSLRQHRSRGLDGVALDAQTLILTMTPEHAVAVRQWLDVAPRPASAPPQVEVLIPYARARGADLPPGDALADPIGRGAEAYEEVASILQAAVTAIARAWSLEFTGLSQDGSSVAELRTKTIALPRLGGLRPTLESTALKLQEEAGELAEAIGKYRALSGERALKARPPRQVMSAIGRELLDVAQTAVTMMFVLEEQYGVSLDALVRDHVRKLAAKGYLADDPGPQDPKAQRRFMA